MLGYVLCLLLPSIFLSLWIYLFIISQKSSPTWVEKKKDFKRWAYLYFIVTLFLFVWIVLFHIADLLTYHSYSSSTKIDMVYVLTLELPLQIWKWNPFTKNDLSIFTGDDRYMIIWILWYVWFLTSLPALSFFGLFLYSKKGKDPGFLHPSRVQSIIISQWCLSLFMIIGVSVFFYPNTWKNVRQMLTRRRAVATNPPFILTQL